MRSGRRYTNIWKRYPNGADPKCPPRSKPRIEDERGRARCPARATRRKARGAANRFEHVSRSDSTPDDRRQRRAMRDAPLWHMDGQFTRKAAGPRAKRVRPPWHAAPSGYTPRAAAQRSQMCACSPWTPVLSRKFQQRSHASPRAASISAENKSPSASSTSETM